jgi:hypothetical protein
MKKLLLPFFFIIVILFSTNISAQKYAVYFTDKNDTPYSIETPEAFLSQRSLERRDRHKIDVIAQDLPVNPQYVTTLKSMGAKVPFTSRWLNCALVSCSSTVINQIAQLPFVSHYVYASPGSYNGKSGEGEFIDKFSTKFEKEEDFVPVNVRGIDDTYNYGQGFSQINQINGIPVHEQGFTGEGVLIAVLDAGFTNVNTLPVFSKLFSEGRLVFTKDIVVPGGNVYNNTHSHGTNVLSCMSAYTENSFVGTAPKASFALIRTEEDPGENLIECYNWVVGIELADSLGVDIVNTSLGYTDFDDPSMNYTFSQLDGETPVASFAAKCAIERGIFVTVSAGNNGSSNPSIGSPADAKFAATIAAVDASGKIASFSSIGPANAAGDPKPNTCAQGVEATVYSTYGTVSSAAGTSFSSPITCGMYACLIQANPKIHPKVLRDIVDKTGDRYPNHDKAYGYGIPNFANALDTALAMVVLPAHQYAVHFKDKNNSPYSIDRPLEYLSKKALDRRNKYEISVTESDFPVNPNYIESVSATGALISASSRWSNSVLVFADEKMLEKIEKLSFVEKTVYVKPAEGTYKNYEQHPKWMDEIVEFINHPKTDYDYGYALAQIEQLNGVFVHKKGYTGKGVLIALLDGGFQNADEVTGFTHLFESGRIIFEDNVVEPELSIYDAEISNHGTMVLSCMGGFIDGEYVGTAPQASYALIRTEDTPTEYLIEEYFWMMGAEKADSIGADIINSSLGYTVFDDTLMNHTYAAMDGRTAVSSIAAKMAVERGVFVCNSAGNNYWSNFPWVGSPADAPEVLSLAAVNLEGEIASFSSIGPNGAGDLKPDVAACGSYAAVIRPDNLIGFASGTSFSSPITCGMVACVIQAAPNKKPAEILKAIQMSADRYPEHDIQYGYGIPDFGKVLQLLDVLSVADNKNASNLVYYPNPVNDKLYLTNNDKIIINVELYDIAGKLLKNIAIDANHTSVDVKGIGTGIIFVKVKYDNGESENIKCVVTKN